MKPAKSPFSRVIGEAVLIFASVFVAIWLESMWQDHKNVTDARVALSQLLDELQADQALLERVKEEQTAFGEMNENLLSWFADPESLPKELVHETLEKYDTSLTMWPRRAAWTTMVAAGQLSLLEDKNLVASLGNYYEYTVRRFVYNGEDYDQDAYEIARESIPRIWDFQHRKLLTSDPERIAVFRGQIRNIDGWVRWYLGYIEEYATELGVLIDDVEQHLQAHGYEA